MRLYIKQIYHYLYCLFVFTLPFIELVKAIPNIIIGLLAILLPFVVKKTDFIQLKQPKYLLTFGLVLFIILSSFFLNTFNSDLYVIKKLILIIVLAILSVPISNYKDIFMSFIISVFLSVLVSSFRIINLILEEGSFNFSSGDVINAILINERLYFGLLCCLSIMFSLKLANEYSLKPIIKKFLVINNIICVVFILTIVARMAIISLALIFLIRAFSKLTFKYALISIIGTLVVVTIFFSLNKNLSQRFLYSQQKYNLIEMVKIWEPRYVIWNCGLDILKDSNSNILLGEGFYRTKQNLIDCYSVNIDIETRKEWFISRGFNTHNQYLDFLLSYGIFAILLFCVLLTYLLYIFRKNIENLSIILIIVFFCVIENIFHRQLGVFLFSLVLCNTLIFKEKKSIQC